MRWKLWIFAVLLSTTAQASDLRFDELAVQWQPEERWLWQGQALSSRQFSSDQDVITVAQHIQQLAHQQDVDVRVQRLSSALLLSFEDTPSQQHYLFMLSAQATGTAGWFSVLTLPSENKRPSLVSVLPQAVFKGLYQHGWSLQGDDPVYALLQPSSSSPRLWQRLQNRLTQQHWAGGHCEAGRWCQWHKQSQKLWVWVDQKHGLWHVLWWQKSS